MSHRPITTFKRGNRHCCRGVNRAAARQFTGHGLCWNIHLAALLVDVVPASLGVVDVAGQSHAFDVVRREQRVVQVIKVLLVLCAECLEKSVLNGVRAVGGVGVAGLADKDGLGGKTALHVIVKIPGQHGPAAVCTAPKVKVVYRVIPGAHPVADADVAHQGLHIPVFFEPFS